jgi:hypothetical protein
VVTSRLIRLILKMNDSKASNPSGGGYATNSAVDVCQIINNTTLRCPSSCSTSHILCSATGGIGNQSFYGCADKLYTSHSVVLGYIERNSQDIKVRLTGPGRANCGKDIDIHESDIQKLRRLLGE